MSILFVASRKFASARTAASRAFSREDLRDALDSARLEVGWHIGLGHNVQAGEARAETTRERKA